MQSRKQSYQEIGIYYFIYLFDPTSILSIKNMLFPQKKILLVFDVSNNHDELQFKGDLLSLQELM